MKLGLLAGAIAVAICGVIFRDRMNKRKAQRLLGARVPLDAGAFGRVHFGESEYRARLATTVREVLARHVPYPLEGLAPDDAFVGDLRMDQLDSMSTVEFVVDLERTLGMTLPGRDIQALFTFRQLTDYLEKRTQQERSERAG